MGDLCSHCGIYYDQEQQGLCPLCSLAELINKDLRFSGEIGWNDPTPKGAEE